MIDDEKLLRVAVEAATEAGAILRARFRHPMSHRSKSHAHDLVTEADTEAEAVIRRAVTAATPGCTVVGEEGGADPTSEICWYVDPIDGTYNFVRGIPVFCVSIGVRVAGRYAAGCVYDPVHDEMFTAAGGELRIDGETVGGGSHTARPLVLCDIPTAGVDPVPAESRLVTEVLGIAADIRRIGSSALALAYVAAGRAEIAANADIHPWDTAAGRVLVTAAGGGYRDVPDPAPGGGPGGFVAWAPGWQPLGRHIARALAAIHRDSDGHGPNRDGLGVSAAPATVAS